MHHISIKKITEKYKKKHKCGENDDEDSTAATKAMAKCNMEIWNYERITYITYSLVCILVANMGKRERKLRRSRAQYHWKWSTMYSITVEHQKYVALAISVLKNKCAAYTEYCASYPYSFWTYSILFIFSFFFARTHDIFLVWCLLSNRMNVDVNWTC